MSTNEPEQRIVIRRAKRAHHAHHGGAWKIAYADFITAMMAFFLIMWILSLVPKENLGEMAEHFNRPLIEAVFATKGSGQDRSMIPGKSPSPIPNPNPLPTPQNIPQTRAVLPENVQNGRAERIDVQRLENLKEQIEQLINTDPVLKQFRPQMILDITSEGLRVQIVDQQNRPMFLTGSAAVQPYMRSILRELAPLFNEIPNSLTISGHTDATPYAMGERGYSNWELSSDRAHAARQELIAAGLVDSKVKRVIGLASTVGLVQDDPYAAVNRRISLIVLNAKTEALMDAQSSTRTLNIDANLGGLDKAQQDQPSLTKALDQEGSKPIEPTSEPAPEQTDPPALTQTQSIDITNAQVDNNEQVSDDITLMPAESLQPTQ